MSGGEHISCQCNGSCGQYMCNALFYGKPACENSVKVKKWRNNLPYCHICACDTHWKKHPCQLCSQITPPPPPGLEASQRAEPPPPEIPHVPPPQPQPRPSASQALACATAVQRSGAAQPTTQMRRPGSSTDQVGSCGSPTGHVGRLREPIGPAQVMEEVRRVNDRLHAQDANIAEMFQKVNEMFQKVNANAVYLQQIVDEEQLQSRLATEYFERLQELIREMATPASPSSWNPL